MLHLYLYLNILIGENFLRAIPVKHILPQNVKIEKFFQGVSLFTELNLGQVIVGILQNIGMWPKHNN